MEHDAVFDTVTLCRTEQAPAFLPQIDPADADAEFYQAVAENDDEFYTVCCAEEPVGLACISDEGPDSLLYIYIFAPHRNKGYGSAAAYKAEELLHTPAMRTVNTFFDSRNEAAVHFAQKCGFVTGYASACMVYEGKAFALAPLPVRPYTDGDFTEAFTLSAEAFHQMRLSTGWFPNSTVAAPSEETRQHWAETADERFVYVQEGEIVGYARIDGAELDTAAVKIAQQGKGYGTAFIQYLVNRILEQTGEPPFLYCVVGNRARKLYEKLGFRETACNAYAKKTFSAAN